MKAKTYPRFYLILISMQLFLFLPSKIYSQADVSGAGGHAGVLGYY